MASLALALAGCGGGSSITGEDEAPTFGDISFTITDAPVDTVDEVWVQFTGVTLNPQGGAPIEVPFPSTVDIELLGLQGGTTATLVPPTTVPAGTYTWVRLAVNAEFDGVFDSYAVRDGGQIELRVPSGGSSGLQVNGNLTVTQSQTTSFVLDWDLRQSLTDPAGQPGFILRPVIRVTSTTESGNLAGTVADSLLNDDLNGDATCANDLNLDTGNAVYVYPGTVESPDDMQNADVSPLVTGTVSFDGNDYRYSIAFLDPGEYTAAFTCQALNDDPETDDDVEFASVVTRVTIVNGETTVQDFTAQ